MTQHASMISPLIDSALKLILFIVLIIKALRTTRNIKHAWLRAVIKYFISFNHCIGFDKFVLRIPARFYIAIFHINLFFQRYKK